MRGARHSARLLEASAALLSFSVLADSGIEHYRGSFANKAMWTPIGVAALALAAGLKAACGRRAKADDAIFALAAATGLAGTGFHAYNIGKRPGGFSFLDLFYGAPAGAPAALSLAGLFGLAAGRLRRSGGSTRLLGLPAGRALAGLTAAGIAGTVAEAALLHYRGAFQNPVMVAPVTIPPVTAALMGLAASGKAGALRRLARWLLALMGAIGLAGVGFHAFGVSRHRGGWANWRQTLLAGPPTPAPPAFAALALAGLAALELREERRG